MTSQTSKNFVESILEAQKSFVDTIVENTKKATQGNAFINESLEKGSEAYSKWVENQKTVLGSVEQRTEEVKEKAKEQINKANEQYQNWFNNQVEQAKSVWEYNQNWFKNAVPNFNAMPNFSNPADYFNQWNNWVNQNNPMNNNWINFFQQFQPNNMSDVWKKSTEQFSNFYNQYNELLGNTFSQLQNNFGNTTTKDAYGNFINVAESYGKFYELMSPFWKSIQEKTFNADQFKNVFNFESYKGLIDKFFGFAPDQTREYFQKMSEFYNTNLKGAMANTRNQYQSAQDFWMNSHPFAGQNFFEQATQNYQTWQNNFKNAVAPIAKMITPNEFTKNAEEWAKLADRMALYQIKNAELQLMTYKQSGKVLDKLAESIANKIENGTEINSLTTLYQEWLNISDKVYIELFESDEYSKLMAEVSAIQLRLKKDVETEIEKSLAGVPVAKKSELDELYKIIYDLKKEVRQLEKMLEVETENTEATTEEVTVANSAKKTATKRTSKASTITDKSEE